VNFRIPSVVLIGFFSLHLLAAAQAPPLWQVGSFDASSAEFNQEQPRAAVVVDVGQQQPSRDWYAFAPAALPGKPVTPETAPRIIAFSLAGAIQPAYRLTLSILIEHSSVPEVAITINGHSGRFVLHPKLDDKMGDTMDAFFPAYSRAEVLCDFPGSWLHRRENEIALQPISSSAQGVPDAGFNYDAIQLEPLAQRPTVTPYADPTIFYQSRSRALDERVDVFVRYTQPLRSSRVSLRLAGHTFTGHLDPADAFGEQRLRFLVPEFPANSPAQIQVDLNGRKQQFTQTLQPAKKWTLYLVPHVHLDIGYTDYQAKVAAIQARILDEAMDLADQHPGFRFSTDGDWNLEQFLHSRTPQEQQRIVQAIRDQKIYIPAQSSNLLTGFPTAETLIRSLYPSADFSRINGTPYNYANITDVPSYSWSYASILAAAGVHFFAAGSNNDRAPVLLMGHLNQQSPFWWKGPDGGKVLMWYSRHYMQMQFLFGLPPLTETGEEILPLFLQMYEHPDYRASAAIVFGTQVENTDLFPQQAELAGQWNVLYAFPRIEYSGFHDAMAAIALQFGNSLPTIQGDGGPYWEDGIGSDARFAAIERRNESRAPTAEKLATISTLVSRRLAVDRGRLSAMWADMVLMDEHTWTSWNSVSDPASQEAVQQLRVKDSRATTASGLCDDLMRSSMASLADRIQAGVNSLIVFNGLNWDRDGDVTIDLDHGWVIADPATGQAVPSVTLSDGPNYRPVVFRAQDVPAMGYKVYSLRESSASPPALQSATATTLNTPFYSVELDPSTGSIRSLYDKQLGRELVDSTGPWRLGQYLYVSGGDEEPNSILQYRAVSPKPVLHIHPAAHGRLVSEQQTPWGWRVVMESSTDNTPSIRTTLRLFNHEKKIELIEEVDKQPELKKEAVYFAFPFAMSHPRFRYEIQNGVVDPATDMVPGAGREWFSVQHWVSVEQDGVSATVLPLDAPLVTLGDINRGAWPDSFGQRPGAIFSYIMNNYWHTNYRAEQGGAFRFRYVITSAAQTDAPTLSRLGWEEVTPLEQDQIRSQDKALDGPEPLPSRMSQFLSVNDPDVLVDTWKPAEDGKGTILRLIDLGGAPRTLTMNVPLLTLTRVVQTDAVERDGAAIVPDTPHTFHVQIHPHQIVTLRLLDQPQ
jgi:hypothetical protein